MTDWHGLFSLGQNFADFRRHGFAHEMAAVDAAEARLSAPEGLSATTRARIAALSQPARLIVAAELWCPDCQRNVTAFHVLCTLTPHLQMRIITRSRAERELRPALGLDHIPIPLAVALDAQFNPIGTFIERPRRVIEGDEATLERYRNNGELEAAILDILDLLAPVTSSGD